MSAVQTLFLFFCAFLLAPVARAEDGEPINLTLFYETLCPDTRKFVLDQLAPTYQGAFQSHINLKLVPFGNAHFVDNSGDPPSVTCQHGEAECYGNRLQACFIANYSPNVSRSLDYIKCMFEKDGWKSIYSTSVTCAAELSLDWTKIGQCSNSTEGHRLIADFGQQTLSLVPTIDWIPWITINGEHDDKMRYEALFGLKKYLCENHFHSQTLDACKSGALELSVSFVLITFVMMTARMFWW